MNLDSAPNTMRLYARYLLDVYNDENEAEKVILKYY